MSITTVNGHKGSVSDCEPVRCILEMDSDGQIAVIVTPGCSVPDVHDMLRQLVRCNGHFGHLTLVDDDEKPAPLKARNE